ncbi:ribosome recycling factor [bacterium]|nr:MAG: ribosome recycling factor [bacterium]
MNNDFNKILEHFQKELLGIRTGRAHPSLVEDIMVECYGSMMPVKQIASVSIPEPRTLMISPWDVTVAPALRKALEKKLELNVQNEGTVMRINLSSPTEERRRELVKTIKKKLEEARVSMRAARHKILEEGGSSSDENDATIAKKKMQDEVDNFNKMAEDIAKEKEKEIMQV